MVLALLTSLVLSAISWYLYDAQDDGVTRMVAACFAIGAVIFGALGLYVQVQLIRGKCDDVLIDESGITYRNRFRSWGDIRSFHGTRYSNGICLGYVPKTWFIWGDGSLPTTPLLSEQEYINLAQRLQASISFPDVIIESHPVSPTDS